MVTAASAAFEAAGAAVTQEHAGISAWLKKHPKP
jgi:hypothetical protein